ncbi:MAG TPA: glycosyltransferase family 4 protein [Candidatus Paceibacterota bacterium]
MQKVLFVITKSNWGGAQRYVYDLATNLPKNEFETKVALGGEGPLKEKLQENNISVIQIPHLQRDINFIKEVLSFFSLVKIFNKEKPDVIHLNSSKAGGIGAVAALISKLWTKNYGLKTIFTVHGWAFNETRTFRAKSIIYLSQWITSVLANNTIILSRHDYRQALGMPLINQEKFSLIPLGIPENQMEFLPKQNAKKHLLLQTTKENMVVGTIAEFTKNKGLNYLLDALNILKSPKLHLVVIGDGEEKEKIDNRIENENLKETVTTCGFVPHAAKYIKAFDIFVLPSLKEGLPYTVLESMTAGVPVVASSVGGIPDLIDHEKSGFLTIPQNPESLAKNIKKLVENETLRKQFSRASKTRAIEKFSFASMLERTIKLYEL